MKHDVFISYSRKDSAIVDKIYQELKKYDITCFIDRSNIDLGKDFAEIIAESIYECKVVLFVWSENSNQSDNTANEVALAVEFEKTIVSFKIGTFKPSPKLAYRLVRFNRIDAVTLNEERIKELGKKIAKLLDKKAMTANSPSTNNHPVAETSSTTVQCQDRENDSRLKFPYQAGKEALSGYDIESAFNYLCEPALHDYKDSRLLMAQIVNYRSRIWKVADDEFEPIRVAADSGNSFAQYMMSRFYIIKDRNATEQERYARLSADQGDPFGIFELAICYCFGDGVKRDIPKYLMLLNKAVALDNPFAIIKLAKENLYGWDIKKNILKGKILLKQAMEMDFPEGYSVMGDTFHDISLGEIDDKEAEKYYLKAISSGYFESYFDLGRMCIFDPVTIEIKDKGTEKGIDYFLKGIEFGIPDCMSGLANCYYNGTAVNKDLRLAMKWYRKAAEAGDRSSNFTVGYMYYYGSGVEIDYQLAWEWFERGAKQTDAGSYYMMGVMCQDGYAPGHSAEDCIEYYKEAAFYKGYFGGVALRKLYDIYRTDNLEKYDQMDSEAYDYPWVEQDDEKALEYLRQSAETGDEEALFKFGVYMTDTDLPFADEFQGRKYLEESLAKGYYLAATRLAYLYMYGIGVSKDLSKVRYYGELAVNKTSGGTADYAYGKLLKEYAEGILRESSDDEDDSKETEEQKLAKEIIEEAKVYLKRACDDGYEKAYQQYYATLLTILTYVDYSDEPLKKEMLDYLNKTIKSNKYKGAQPLVDMGVCCEIGIGREMNIDEAIEWYTKASDLKYPIGAMNIARIYYEKKDEDPYNLIKAALWYEKAAEYGNSDAKDYLSQVEDEIKGLGI